MSGAYQDWVGRSETRRDVLSPAPLSGLAALLDADGEPWLSAPPPLAHWLYFLPAARQSDIDVDGHPRRGGFLPPIDLPRRMWAGGRLTFHAPLRVGADMEQVSTIKAITSKTGASGDMVFVTVAHEVRADGVVAVNEEQDIVYRAAGGVVANGAIEPREPEYSRDFLPSETLLFRFSALTFNAHRIHYDRRYARDAEGYPGLVVQGPLIATLLMHHALSAIGAVRAFSFRAKAPLFDGSTATLCADASGALWCRDHERRTVMTAEAEPA